MSLTRKQAELLTFIDGYIKEHGFAPTHEEMRAHFGHASKSGVNRIIDALEAHAYVRRTFPGAYRCLEVLRLPGQAEPTPSGAMKLAEYHAALSQIAAGDGTYGAQAFEYKQIARKALGMPT